MVARRVKIVTDSTAYFSPEEITRYDVSVIPLRVIFGTTVYTEGADITSDEFYRRIARGGPVPTTSQPAISDFTKVYSELAEQGYDILSIHISSRLSGTVGSALAARQELPDARIEVIDARTIALRVLIAPAAQAAAEGQSLPWLKESMEKLNSCIGTVGMLNTLEYLWKGGRIGGAKALLGTLLRIKPLLDFRSGEVKVMARLRTNAQAMDSILGIMHQRIKGNSPAHVSVAHADALESALTLKERVRDGFNCADLDIVELGPVLGTHIGPGFFGVGFYCDDDWRPQKA